MFYSNKYGKSSTVVPEIDFSLLATLSKKSNNEHDDIVTKNYDIENYNINTCTDKQTNIFLNIINKTTYQNYECIIYESDLDSPLDIGTFVKIFDNCLTNKPNYSFKLELQTELLLIHFLANLDGIFKISQTVTIKEKQFNADKQLSSKIIELETRIKELETETIIFGWKNNELGKLMFVKRNIDVIDFRCWEKSAGWEVLGNILDFNKLCNLKNIILFNNQFNFLFTSAVGFDKIIAIAAAAAGASGSATTRYYDGSYAATALNVCTEEARIAASSAATTTGNVFDDFKILLPNVTQMSIHYKDAIINFNNHRFKSLPNLRKVVFEQFGNNQLNTFQFIKGNKINHIVYNNCLNIAELDLIKIYFETNNLRIEITNN